MHGPRTAPAGKRLCGRVAGEAEGRGRERSPAMGRGPRAHSSPRPKRATAHRLVGSLSPVAAVSMTIGERASAHVAKHARRRPARSSMARNHAHSVRANSGRCSRAGSPSSTPTSWTRGSPGKILAGVAAARRDREHVGWRHAEIPAAEVPFAEERCLHAVDELVVHDRAASQHAEHHERRDRHAEARGGKRSARGRKMPTKRAPNARLRTSRARVPGRRAAFVRRGPRAARR